MPVLQTAYNHPDGYQVFTDSYVLFRFYKTEIIDVLPSTNNDATYPSTEKLVDPIFENGIKSNQLQVKTLKTLCKTSPNEYIEIGLGTNNCVKLGIKNLQTFLTIMGLKNREYISFIYIQSSSKYIIKPIGVKVKNKDGIIMPMRTE